MSLLTVCLALSIIACIVIVIQSIRVYRSSNLKPALFFAAAAGALILSLSAVLAVQTGAELDVFVAMYVVGLHLSVLGLCLLSVYVLSKNRTQLTLGVLSSIAVVGLHCLLLYQRLPSGFLSDSGNVNQSKSVAFLSIVTVILITPLIISMIRQFAEAISRPLVAVRLLLMLLLDLLILYVYVADSFASTATLSSLVVVYSLTLVTVLLALTSLLTPIRRQSKVTRPVY